MNRTFLVAAFLAGSVAAHAAPVLVEGFDNVAGLAGWTQTNLSTGPGTTGWFQGNDAIFASQAGAPNSYIAANFENATTGGDIDNWLITPLVTLNDGDTISFHTRAGGTFEDRLEVRLNPNGTTVVGDFTVLLLTVNENLDGSYPADWAQYTLNVAGLGAPTNVTIGFRYFVPDTNTNAEYIGIDTLVVDAAAIPEPATLGLIGAALAGLLALRRTR